MSKPNDFTITLRPLQDQTDPDGKRRLRRVLKFALRSCRLKCVSAEPTQQAIKNATAGDVRHGGGGVQSLRMAGRKTGV